MRTLSRQLVAVLGRGVVPSGDPIATADDVGLVRGDGCFDAMRVLDRGGVAEVENLDQHLARFSQIGVGPRVAVRPAGLGGPDR